MIINGRNPPHYSICVGESESKLVFLGLTELRRQEQGAELSKTQGRDADSPGSWSGGSKCESRCHKLSAQLLFIAHMPLLELSFSVSSAARLAGRLLASLSLELRRAAHAGHVCIMHRSDSFSRHRTHVNKQLHDPQEKMWDFILQTCLFKRKLQLLINGFTQVKVYRKFHIDIC